MFSDLSVLGNMPYLLELDASHNELTTLLDFSPPYNLKMVDMSFNLITTLPDLSMHHYLQTLLLDSILSLSQLVHGCTQSSYIIVD